MEGLLALTPPNGLPDRWRRLRDLDPFVSLADAADRLDVVEADLVAALCGDGVLRLDGPFDDLIRVLPGLGRVRAVTRNRHALIETRGVYPGFAAGCAGVAGEVGARFFLDQWRFGYALDETCTPDGTAGLFFYDGRGRSVHEIHAESETDARSFARLVDLFGCFDQSAGEEIVVASPTMLAPRADLGAWLRLAEAARPVAVAGLPELLEVVRGEAIPVSVGVRSPGVVHRMTGLLHEVGCTDGGLALEAPWVRVRVAMAQVAEAWAVETPSLDGPVTSVELLDAAANVVLTVAGARRPGKPEPELWRELVARLATAPPQAESAIRRAMIA